MAGVLAILIAAGIGIGYLTLQSSQSTSITESPQTTPTSSKQQSNQTVPIKETPKPSSNQSTSGQQAITVEEFLKHFDKYAGAGKEDVIVIGKVYIVEGFGEILLGPPYKDTILWVSLSPLEHNVTKIKDGIMIDGTIIIKNGDTVIVKGNWDETEGFLYTEFSKYYVGFNAKEIRKVP